MSNAVVLIARREIVTRWQQKGYRISAGATLLIAAIAVIIPSFFSGGSDAKSYDLGVTPRTAALAQVLSRSAAEEHVQLTVHRADADEARSKVDDGTWDAALLPGPTVLATQSSDGVVGFVQQAYARETIEQRLRAAGLDDAQISRSLQVDPLAVESTRSGQDTQRQTLSIITVIVLFSQLIAFCTWVATGVVEEKTSRVVELILSSVRPIQLLAGKLVGIGLLASAQLAAIGTVALVAASVAGTLTLPVSSLLTVLISFAAFVLGFAFFAALSAALASTVSRQEEVSGVMAPVSVLVMVCYFAAFTATSGDGSSLSRVLSIVPPVSCLAMPARIARGAASGTDVVLAIVLLLAATMVALVMAAKIYRVSVLHTGTRLKLKQAWRGEEIAATPR